jgi:uncharacterized membrane protein
MIESQRFLRAVLVLGGLAHLVIGAAGMAFPRWFFSAAPPWPPLHVGQIQIGGIFDLAMAVLFLASARDLARYLPLAVFVGVVAEWGHASVRIGHILAGDNPTADLLLPSLMLVLGGILVWAGTRRTQWHAA